MSGEAASYYAAGQGPPPAANNNSYDAEQHGGMQQQKPPEYGNGNDKQDFSHMFKLEGPKYHDIWAGVLFLACVGAFAAVSGITLHAYAKTRSGTGGGIYDGDNTFGLTTNTVICMLVCVGIAFVLSFLYVLLARLQPKLLIWVTGILNIALGLATAIYMLYRRYYSGGIVFLVFTVITIVCFISWIKRIPFSALMLTASVDVARRHGHVFLVSLLGGLAAAAFGVWFSATMVAVYVKYEPSEDNDACSLAGGSCSRGKVIGLMVFVTFAGYWITEWLKNTIHTTISGVYGSWYFGVNEADGAGGNSKMPSGATRSAFRRAVTYSFGSISLGSLIVALINLLRQLCSVARQQAAGDGDILAYILYCVLGCIIWLIDWAVQFVNRYAFCHIALYGSSYFTAAKNTWTMLKQRGADALANACLVGPVFSIGGMFVAYATGLAAYVFLRITDPPYNRDGDFTPVVLAYAYLIGLQVCNIFTTPLSSGIDTLFIAMAWDPHVLMGQHPALYHDMVQVYPPVQAAIHP